MIGLIFIFLTILFTVYGQLVIKQEVSKLGVMPTNIFALMPYLLKAFFNIKILSGIASAVIAMICWFGAVSRLDLSFAYPFMSLSFPIVMFFSTVFLQESFYWSKFVGVLFIIVGLLVVSLRY